jgi:hypothetical protein
MPSIAAARYSEFADLERRWGFGRADITKAIRLPSAKSVPIPH